VVDPMACLGSPVCMPDHVVTSAAKAARLALEALTSPQRADSSRRKSGQTQTQDFTSPHRTGTLSRKSGQTTRASQAPTSPQRAESPRRISGPPQTQEFTSPQRTRTLRRNSGQAPTRASPDLRGVTNRRSSRGKLKPVTPFTSPEPERHHSPNNFSQDLLHDVMSPAQMTPPQGSSGSRRAAASLSPNALTVEGLEAVIHQSRRSLSPQLWADNESFPRPAQTGQSCVVSASPQGGGSSSSGAPVHVGELGETQQLQQQQRGSTSSNTMAPASPVTPRVGSSTVAEADLAKLRRLSSKSPAPVEWEVSITSPAPADPFPSNLALRSEVLPSRADSSTATAQGCSTKLRRLSSKSPAPIGWEMHATTPALASLLSTGKPARTSGNVLDITRHALVPVRRLSFKCPPDTTFRKLAVPIDNCQTGKEPQHVLSKGRLTQCFEEALEVLDDGDASSARPAVTRRRSLDALQDVTKETSLRKRSQDVVHRVYQRPASNSPDQAPHVLTKGRLTQMFEEVLEEVGGVRRVSSREHILEPTRLTAAKGAHSNKRKTSEQSGDGSTRRRALQGRCSNGIIQRVGS